MDQSVDVGLLITLDLSGLHSFVLAEVVGATFASAQDTLFHPEFIQNPCYLLVQGLLQQFLVIDYCLRLLQFSHQEILSEFGVGEGVLCHPQLVQYIIQLFILLCYLVLEQIQLEYISLHLKLGFVHCFLCVKSSEGVLPILTDTLHLIGLALPSCLGVPLPHISHSGLLQQPPILLCQPLIRHTEFIVHLHMLLITEPHLLQLVLKILALLFVLPLPLHTERELHREMSVLLPQILILFFQLVDPGCQLQSNVTESLIWLFISVALRVTISI